MSLIMVQCQVQAVAQKGHCEEVSTELSSEEVVIRREVW